MTKTLLSPAQERRLERATLWISRLGVRAAYETLRYAASRAEHPDDVIFMAERIAALDPRLLAAAGGDRLPVRPAAYVIDSDGEPVPIGGMR